MIPKKLYLTNHSKPEAYIARIQSWNPDLEILFFNNLDCENFISEHFEPEVLHAYRSIKPGAYKADIFRYCVLYINGGIYSDIFVPYQRSFASLWDLSNNYLYLVLGADKGESIQISTMASPKRCHFFKMCIDQCVRNINTRNYSHSPYAVTGPHLAGACLLEYLDQDELQVGKIYSPKSELDHSVNLQYQFVWLQGEARRIISRSAFIDSSNQILFPYKLHKNRKNWSDRNHYYNAWHAGNIYGEKDI